MRQACDVWVISVLVDITLCVENCGLQEAISWWGKKGGGRREEGQKVRN